MSNATPLRERGPMVGTMLESDFTKDTITFHMPATYYAAAGRYIIEPEADWLRRKEQAEAATVGDATRVFNCHRCPVSVESRWQPPDCPECGDPCELDVTAKPATPPASAEADGPDMQKCAGCGSEWPDYLLKDGKCIKCRKTTPPAASGANSITHEQAIRAIDTAVDALNDSGWPALSAEVREALTFIRRLAAVAPAGMDDEVAAYLAESDREAYVFHANDGESLDAYTADGFTVTPLVRSTRAQPDSVMPAEVVRQQASLYSPATQVFFRAGLIACREYMARFVQAESPSIAASIRANWWPNLGQDFGPPRKIDWNELTEGEFGTPSFRVKSAGEVSPTLEALPIALGFLELSAAPTPPATAGQE